MTCLGKRSKNARENMLSLGGGDGEGSTFVWRNALLALFMETLFFRAASAKINILERLCVPGNDVFEDGLN